MRSLFIGLALLLASLEARALSVSYLYGGPFRHDLGYNSKKLTMTLEHFQLWELGNVFFYYDITEPFSHSAGQSNQFFGGIAPTMSLSKLTGKSFEFGFIKDISLRYELENGSGYGVNNFRNYFYGLQYDLAIPYFDFFTFNTVVRDNPMANGVGFQFGMFWQMTWDYGYWNKWKFTGFLATSPWDGNQNDKKHPWFSNHGRYLTTQPQFLYDLGYGIWRKPNRMEVGCEYNHFWNRYQLARKTENAIQAMVKLTF